jgi:hypothetical protein
MLREAGNAMCLTCHGPNTQNGPHAGSIEQHTHHAAGSKGSACAACHMSAIAETLGDVKVRSHTFRLLLTSMRSSCCNRSNMESRKLRNHRGRRNQNPEQSDHP